MYGRVSKFVELSVVLSVMFALNATLNSTINNTKFFYKKFVLSHLLLLLMCLARIVAKRSKKFGLNGHKVKRRLEYPVLSLVSTLFNMTPVLFSVDAGVDTEQRWIFLKNIIISLI